MGQLGRPPLPRTMSPRPPQPPGTSALATAVLIASIGLNVLLLRAFWQPAEAARPFVSLSDPASAASISSATFLAPLPAPATWSMLADADARQLTQQLRTAGLPESLVRQIVWTQLRRKSVRAIAAATGAPYWRHEALRRESLFRDYGANGGIDPAWAAYVALFDAAPDESANPGQFLVESALMGLPPETALRERRITGEYFSAVPLDNVARDREAMSRYFAERERQLQTDLQAAMTAEEYRDYSLRASIPINRLLQKTAGLRPTQAEYDALATIINDLGGSGLGTSFSAAMQTQIEAALGPERFAEYVQAVEGTAATNRVVARLGLPLTAAATIDATRNEINQRAKSLKADSTLSPETRDAQLAALAVEARQRITAAVTTATGYDAYYEYQGGWIKDITGTPPAEEIDPTASPGP